MIGRLLKSRYELVGLLQDGPIFATYSARDKIQGRDLSIRVVKAPFSQESEFIDRLVSTVQRYSAIQSQNVERLHSVETDETVPFIIGDLTRGPSLEDRIRKLAPFSIPVSVGTAISILHALDAVHRVRLVHGDLNPQNLAVMADGDVRLQLTGIWESYSASPTAGVMVLPGMAPYLAPEVSAGAMPSPRSDVYAVGILLYQLITGRLPYHAESPLAMALQHSTAPTPSLRSISIAVPSVLDEIVKKAMAKDPSNRYTSASDMMADLRLLQDSLRFGRSLTWPLRPEALQPGPAPTGRGPASRPQPVAPRMSAIRENAETVEQKQRKERDVPVWMWIPLTIGATLVVTCVGLWILQNLNRPVWVTVPKIKMLSVGEATSMLHDKKLTLRITRHESNDNLPPDTVLDEEPQPGEKVREGGQVSVTVSSGSRFVAVPVLKGSTLDQARGLLSKVNLGLSSTVETIADPKVPIGLVVRSDPSALAKVERQSLVKLYVSSGPSEETTSSESVPGDGYVYTLHLKLKDLPHRTLVRIDMVDGSDTKTVYSQLRNSGDSFDVQVKASAQKVTFNIYYDSALVKSIDKEAEGDQSSDQTIQPATTDSGTDGQ